ncbi:MAG TPA: sugar ABC transporter substrate-binding protein, partial [Saprospiraceae bacterium]|nr:sugar ABC transporter substrate-binding protein [Saprospiraceae bacterium]
KTVQHYGVIGTMYLFDLFDANSFVEKANELFDTQPDAILFSPLFLKESKELLLRAKERAIPNVMFNTNIENTDSLSYIGPDSYQSGVLAGRLLDFAQYQNPVFIILNLAKGSTNAHHLLQKEKGFRDYFKDAKIKNFQVKKYDFEGFDQAEKMHNFTQKLLKKHTDIAGIFVTNSRAFKIAENLSPQQAEKINIVGFDLLSQNLDYLKSNKINFLINQNSVQQGYWGIMSLFNHFILKQSVEQIQNLPLDIVVLENYAYYLQKEKSFQMAI